MLCWVITSISEKILESFEVEDFMIQIKLLVHVWKFSFMFFVVYLE